MAYATLKPRQDYLGHYHVLQDSMRVEAELTADLWVDSHFQDWERELWAGDAVPADIRRCALLIGSSEYIQRDFAAANPAVEDLPLVIALREQATSIYRESKGRGWLMGTDRERLYSKDGDKSFKSARAVR